MGDKKTVSSATEVVLLYCRQCVNDPDSITVAAQRTTDFKVKPVMMPCSSKIEVPNILKILANGADAVQVVACPEDECQFLTGSNRAEKRIDYARGLLEQINVSPDRLNITRKSNLSADDLIKLAAECAKQVKPLGPGPMKKGAK